MSEHNSRRLNAHVFLQIRRECRTRLRAHMKRRNRDHHETSQASQAHGTSAKSAPIVADERPIKATLCDPRAGLRLLLVLSINRRAAMMAVQQEGSMKVLSIVLLLICSGLPAVGRRRNILISGWATPNDVNDFDHAGTVLMGGGTDVDAAFQWMCQRSGNGDFLVIRATGTDAYNPYIQQLCPNENSVATLIIPNLAAASDPFVISTIQNAEALWIAGGDQSNYINFWKGTPVQTEINAVITRDAPIGGTSAGMNVLTQFVYSALAGQGADFEPVAGRSVQPVHHARS